MYMTFWSIFQRLARPLRFGVVGLSGIVVNSAILWVLVRELHLAVTLGSVLAEDEERLRKNRVPDSFEPPRKSFTILLPARHEEAVIKDTIQRTVDLNYPRELVQILVVIEAGDTGTIAEVTAKLAELRAQGIAHVRLIPFDDPPINKPHGLNVALRSTVGDV